MPYDEGLAQRIHEYFGSRPDVEAKKMFGGLCFMVEGHMCCGIVGDLLMLRVGPENYQAYLGKTFVKEMDFTGKSMKGMLYVIPEGFECDSQLLSWIHICELFVKSLPPRSGKRKGSQREIRTAF